MKLFLPNGGTHDVPAETKPLPTLDGVPQAEQSYDYKEESIQYAAQCWQDEETKDKVFDAGLAFAFAKRLAFFIQTAADYARGAEYYRGIIDQCGAHIGIEAFTSDDGTIQEDAVAARLPELVQKLTEAKA